MRFVTTQAEEAIGSINELQALRSLHKQRTKRLMLGRRSQPQADRLLDELAVGRVVASAEAYLLMRAVVAAQPLLLQPSYVPAVGDIATKRLRKAAKSFPQLVEVWRIYLSMDLKTLVCWAEFDRLRELRHVLVHRLGQWQPNLDPKPKLEYLLRDLKLHPPSYRGPIPLHAHAFEEAILTTMHLIDELEPP